MIKALSALAVITGLGAVALGLPIEWRAHTLAKSEGRGPLVLLDPITRIALYIRGGDGLLAALTVVLALASMGLMIILLTTLQAAPV
jgi:hypothetical protein